MEVVTVALIIVIFLVLWILPIFLGIKVALKKNRSPHWMWFGIHPVGGWIAFLVLINVSGLKECKSCGEKIKTYAKTCPYCNTEFPQETITYKKAKKRNPLIPILIIISLLCVFVFFMFLMISELFESSVSYKQTMGIVSSNPSVINELGLPIKRVGFISGSINNSETNGSASYSINLKGSKERAKVYIDSIKKAYVWSFNSLSIKFKNGHIVNLLEK